MNCTPIRAVDATQPEMHDHMKKMMRQMDEIHKTKDLDKRERLIEMHMRSMHEGIEMMRGMCGQMMMEKMVQSRRVVEQTQKKLHDHRKIK